MLILCAQLLNHLRIRYILVRNPIYIIVSSLSYSYKNLKRMFAKACFLHRNDNICYNKINVKEALILIVLLFQVAETLLKDENEVVLRVGYGCGKESP